VSPILVARGKLRQDGVQLGDAVPSLFATALVGHVTLHVGLGDEAISLQVAAAEGYVGGVTGSSGDGGSGGHWPDDFDGLLALLKEKGELGCVFLQFYGALDDEASGSTFDFALRSGPNSNVLTQVLVGAVVHHGHVLPRPTATSRLICTALGINRADLTFIVVDGVARFRSTKPIFLDDPRLRWSLRGEQLVYNEVALEFLFTPRVSVAYHQGVKLRELATQTRTIPNKVLIYSR
jgi:hypothetical protein